MTAMFAWTTAPAQTTAPFNVRQVALLLGCSTRHVPRLTDAERMPAPVRLGSLLRWRRDEVQAWIDGGCKGVRDE